MAKVSPAIDNFNAGELSPLLIARDQLKHYKNAVKYSRNMIHSLQGPSRKRQGTRFIAATKTAGDRSWLARLEFNITQSYVLEFGDRYIRFYTNHGQLQGAAFPAWSAVVNYVVADLVSRLGVNYYCIKAHINQQPPNAAYWYPLTGTIYEIPSPYLLADLTAADGTFNLSFTPSNDIMYITSASRTYAPYKLSRLGASSFKLELTAIIGGPFKKMNADISASGFKILYAAGTGAVYGFQVIAPGAGGPFVAGHVGSLFYLENADDDQWSDNWEPGKVTAINDNVWSENKQYVAITAATTGTNRPIHTHGDVKDGKAGVTWRFICFRYIVGMITAVVSAREASAPVFYGTDGLVTGVPKSLQAGAGNGGSNRWAFGAWSTVEGWPTDGMFFRERLMFARDLSLWGSKSADFENFDKYDTGFNVVADGALTVDIQSDESNFIRWMAPTDTALMVGTAGEEHAISEITASNPFGPGNVKSRKQSNYGSRHIPPARVGSDTLYVQRAGRKLMTQKYDAYVDRYPSSDQTVLAEHIGKGGFVDMAYQQEPLGVSWLVRGDGKLVGFTVSSDQEVTGFHSHRIGGTVANGGFAVVESLEVIFSPDGKRHEVWLQVRRVINGATVRYIEYIDASREDGDDQEDCFYVDAGLTLDNVKNATLTPGAGANVDGTVGVVFTAGAAIFAGGDVGKYIHYRYSVVNVDDTVTWDKGVALITAFTDNQHVVATINRKWPSLALIPANGWRMTFTQISGFGHLEGQTIDICADGAAHAQKTVVGGIVNLDTPAGKAHGGLPCSSVLTPMPITSGAADGTGQGKTGRISRAVVRFFETLGAKYGRAETGDMKPVVEESSAVPMDMAPALFTGNLLVDWPDGYTDEQIVTIVQDKPLPCTVVLIAPQFNLQDSR